MRKIINTYIGIGVLIAIVISVMGGYRDLVLNPVIVSLTINEFIFFIMLVILLWLPICLIGVFIDSKYLISPIIKFMCGGIVCIFFLIILKSKGAKKIKQKNHDRENI